MDKPNKANRNEMKKAKPVNKNEIIEPKHLDTTKDKSGCKCIQIIGHLESVKWQEHRDNCFNLGRLALDDWTRNPFIWLHYIEKSDGILTEDDALLFPTNELKRIRWLDIVRKEGNEEFWQPSKYSKIGAIHFRVEDKYNTGKGFTLLKQSALPVLSKETEYWDIDEVQRYFTGDRHCEKVLFVYPYPYPRMPTPHGSHLWRSNTALKMQSSIYQRELYNSMELTLKRMAMARVQMDRLVVTDCFIKLDRLDYFRRKDFFRQLQHILSFQDRLQLVSLENLCCKRIEGVSILQHLACFNAQSLKYLFLWRFVLPNENPLLINYSYITGSGQYLSRPDTRITFLRSLGELRNLRILALEYAHIADGTGGALLSLLPVIKRTHFRLQLICREDQIPGRTDAALGVGGYDIPDTAWRRLAIACPDIYLLFAFFRIRDYDNVRRFLTPSLPLREVHLQLGIDMKMRQRQDSDISCFIRHIAYRYANTLITLSIHQWRFAVFPLRRILELMPKLVRLFYIGKVEDEVEIKRLFHMIAGGVCKNLKQINIQIQDDDKKMDYWRDVVGSVTEEFSDIMQLYNIKFCISLYKN